MRENTTGKWLAEAEEITIDIWIVLQEYRCCIQKNGEVAYQTYSRTPRKYPVYLLHINIASILELFLHKVVELGSFVRWLSLVVLDICKYTQISMYYEFLMSIFSYLQRLGIGRRKSNDEGMYISNKEMPFAGFFFHKAHSSIIFRDMHIFGPHVANQDQMLYYYKFISAQFAVMLSERDSCSYKCEISRCVKWFNTD